MPSVPDQESLELLLEVGRLLSSKLDLQELLTAVMQTAARVVQAETASLLMVDEAARELYFHVALGLDPELAKIRMKMGEGICGSVAAELKPLIINDVRKDSRWTAKVDDESGFVTRSILATPIVLKDRCIGVIEAINKIDGEFTFADLRMFEAFASQSAVAIDNARLFTELQEEKFKLNTVFDEMRDAAVLTDGKGGVRLANPAARRFLGGERSLSAAIAGFSLTPTWDEILRSEDAAMHFEAVREQPKKLIVEGTASVVRDPKTGKLEGRVVVFRDVTEERHEEGLKRSFLSLISHKLKTPLSSVTGYSQLLLEDLKKKSGADFHIKCLGTIQDQGRKLQSLVEKLLNYTVMEELDEAECVRKPFPVGEVLGEAAKSLETFLAECKADMEVRDCGALKAFGDRILVRDCVKNIIENGAKFGSGGGTKLTVWAGRKDGSVEIHIRDTGPGIPPEEQDRIFQKFYQIDSSFTGQIEGWGLGLSFVSKVIGRLGGGLRLDSKIGEGSTFTLTLPAAD